MTKSIQLSQLWSHNPIEMLWTDMKKVGVKHCVFNLSELKEIGKTEWAQISPTRCNVLVKNDHKHQSREKSKK